MAGAGPGGAGLTLRLLDSKLDHGNQHMLPLGEWPVPYVQRYRAIQSELGLRTEQEPRGFTQVNQALLYLCEMDHHEQMISST